MAMAHDVPMAWLEDFGKISLPEYLDYNRGGAGWTKPVVAYHVTKAANVQAILSNGLRGSTCTTHVSDGAERPYAVYLFCARSVVAANLPILFGDDVNASDLVTLKVTIPTTHVDNLGDDGLYNMSFFDAAAMSAIRFFDDVPAEWIEVC